MASSPASSPRPFEIAVPDAVLDDLRRRLAAARWPDEIPGSEWQFGAGLKYLRELVGYWGAEYDWREQERRLNALPQYRVQLDGRTLHFLHVPGKGPDPLPLLLSHGWPGSVFEFSKIIGRLTDPERYGGDPGDSFTVVAPSLPGYGFSPTPDQSRPGVEEIADLFARLMTDVLGYSAFGAQGGDWGAYVTARLAFAHPERLIGIHLNMMPPVSPHPSQRENLTEAETSFLREATSFMAEEGGYQAIQGTRPQTLAYALNDSPTGLAAWIVEKLRAWTDCKGDLESVLSKDEILTLVTLYWVTETINSSFWLYYQLRHHPWRPGAGERIGVPTGFAAFPRELTRPPAEWVARVFNLQHYTKMPAGGHFAALEQPELLAGDIRLFFRTLRPR